MHKNRNRSEHKSDEEYAEKTGRKGQTAMVSRYITEVQSKGTA